MEHSRFSLLPSEIQQEILSDLSLRDLLSFTDAHEIKLTCEQLHELAVKYKLPDATSLDTLLYFYEEKTEEERLRYCVKVNDVASFARLKRDISLYPGIFDILMKGKRHKIANIVILKNIEEKTVSDEDLWLAIKYKEKQLVHLLLSLNVDLERWEIFEDYLGVPKWFVKILATYPSYDNNDFWDYILSYTLHKGDERLVRLALSKNIHGDYIQSISDKLPKDLLMQLLGRIREENIQNILDIALKKGYDDIVVRIVNDEPNYLNLDWWYGKFEAWKKLLSVLAKRGRITKEEERKLILSYYR